MNRDHDSIAKVPAVTLTFWVLKILATTLGETAGDTLSMTLDLGYLVSTAIFAAVFAAAVGAQIRAARFHPWIYWATIIATTTVGTTLADFATRSLGIGYAGGSALLLVLLLASLAIWYRTLGTVSVESVRTPREEVFYWVTNSGRRSPERRSSGRRSSSPVHSAPSSEIFWISRWPPAGSPSAGRWPRQYCWRRWS